jgi:hypothetical protein
MVSVSYVGILSHEHLKGIQMNKLVCLAFSLKFLFFIMIVISSKRTAFKLYFQALHKIYELQKIRLKYKDAPKKGMKTCALI